MTWNVEQRLDTIQKQLGEANVSLGMANAFVNLYEAGENVTQETREEHADNAIDSFKDAYFEAHQAYEVADGSLQFYKDEDIGEVAEELFKSRRDTAKQLMNDLEEQYGNVLDFEGYVQRIQEEQ